MKKTSKMGRPPKSPEEKYVTPGRQFGRVADSEWKLLHDAAKKAGKPFTQWALEILLRNAKRELND